MMHQSTLHNLSRRTFLKQSAAALGVSLAAPRSYLVIDRT